MATIELPRTITFELVEEAHKLAISKQRSCETSYDRGWAERGLMHARQQNPKIMLALDKAAEALEAQREKQVGQYQRRKSIDFADKAAPTEVAIWREAYKSADRGTPEVALMWIYGAAAQLAGLQP